ncbi:MAG: hypothetical protein ACRBFS_07790 [Aureispira sp.]
MMKQLRFTFVLLLLVATQNLFAQGDKTLVKTMDPKGTSMIAFDFRNLGVEAVPWDEGFIRVELEITANFPEQVLAQLVKAGRYTLTPSIDGNVFNVQAKNLDKAVTIGGKDLDDQVRVFIKTPGYYAVSDDGMLQKNFTGEQVEMFVERSANKEEAATTIQKLRQIKDEVYIQYRFVYKGDNGKTSRANTPTSSKKESRSSGMDDTTDKMTKGRDLPPNAGLKAVQERYGDIIIDGAALDMD